MNKRTVVNWIPAFIWMFVIFTLSSQNGVHSGRLSGGVMESLISIISDFMPTAWKANLDLDMLHFYIRKMAHFMAYFVLALLVYWPISKKRKKGVVIITLTICVLYAITDEVHQLLIPGRSGQFKDVLIDSMGSFCGLIGLKGIQKLKRQ